MTAAPGKNTDRDVHVVTSAIAPLSVEQAVRQRRYLVSMLLRTVCVLAAIVVPGPARWLFITAAVVLPYLAVVAANAGRDTTSTTLAAVPGSSHPALPAAGAGQFPQ